MKHFAQIFTLSFSLVYLCNGILLFSCADELQSQTTLGTGSTTEDVSYSGQAAESKWDWNLSYTYSSIEVGASAVKSTAAKSSATDHTHSLVGGVGYSDYWDAGFDLNYSKTKEERLSSFGPSAHLGYTFKNAETRSKSKPALASKAGADSAAKTKESEAEEDEVFSPHLHLVLTGSNSNYAQDYGGPLRTGSRRAAAPITGSQSIRQRTLEAGVSFSAVEWLDIGLSFKRYFYDKNVADFISKLDDPRAIRRGAASFGSTLSGFSSQELSLSFTFHLPSEFELGVEGLQSVSASDSSKTDTYKVEVSKLWQDTWKTGVGFERDQSSSSVQNTTIVTLAYEF